jgi:hypothetical protein
MPPKVLAGFQVQFFSMRGVAQCTAPHKVLLAQSAMGMGLGLGVWSALPETTSGQCRSHCRSAIKTNGAQANRQLQFI